MTFNYQKQYYSVAEVKNIVEIENKALLEEIKTLQKNLEVLRKKKVTKPRKRKNG